MYKRFIYCIIAPILFWISGIMLENNGDERIVPILILFGAILFPLLAAGYKRNKLDLIKYLVVSNLVFYLASISYWYNDRVTPTIFIGAFLGSLAFQNITKYILKAKISIKIMFLISVLSVIALIPFQLDCRNYSKLGFAVFLWMIINSFPLNHQSKNLF